MREQLSMKAQLHLPSSWSCQGSVIVKGKDDLSFKGLFIGGYCEQWLTDLLVLFWSCAFWNRVLQPLKNDQLCFKTTVVLLCLVTPHPTPTPPLQVWLTCSASCFNPHLFVHLVCWWAACFYADYVPGSDDATCTFVSGADELGEVIKDDIWPNPLQYYLASSVYLLPNSKMQADLAVVLNGRQCHAMENRTSIIPV